MKKNVRSTNIFAGGTVLAAVSLITMMLLIFTCMQPAFATDADEASATAVTVIIKAGEHGSVNEKTGEFTETVAQGENLKLMIGCEEGYVIGRVLLNDEPLSASDLKELLGATSGDLDLENLEDDLSVEIIFMTTSEFEIQKEYGQVAEDLSDNDTGSDNNQESSGESGDDSGTQTGTEGTDAGIEDTDLNPSGADTSDSENQSSENADGTDSDSTVADDPSEDLDSLIDSMEALDGDETDDETNWGTIEDSEETDADADTGNDVLTETDTSTDTTVENTSDNTTATETVRAEDTAASDKTDTADSEKGDTDSTDDGKGDYYGTPKTGDESDPYVWFVLIISGLGLAAVSAGSIVRRKLREDDGRWSA